MAKIENQNAKIHLMLHTRNHMFIAAEGLTDIGQLATLGTVYPRFKIKNLGFVISENATKINYFLGLIAYFKQKRGYKLISSNLQMILFDKWASKEIKKLKEPGIVH